MTSLQARGIVISFADYDKPLYPQLNLETVFHVVDTDIFAALAFHFGPRRFEDLWVVQWIICRRFVG